jgi:hypothetical protein
MLLLYPRKNKEASKLEMTAGFAPTKNFEYNKKLPT